MATRRAVLFATGLVFATLCVLFVVIGLERADQLASTVGALAGVCALGLSVWAVLLGSRTVQGETLPAAPTPQPLRDSEVAAGEDESGPVAGQRPGGPRRTLHADVHTSFDMMYVPAGSAWLSSEFLPPREAVSEVHRTAVEVDEFYIGRFPITVRQYDVFVNAANGLRDPRWGDPQWYYIRWEDVVDSALHAKPRPDTAPALVTRFEAVAFCRWLTLVAGTVVTVPTEAQWLRAARGASRSRYPWGDEFDARHCYCGASPAHRGTGSVGHHPAAASRFGVEDLVGNAPEWVVLGSDDDQYRREDTGVIHPRGTWSDAVRPEAYSCDYRGSAATPSPGALAAFRLCGTVAALG